VSALFEKWLHAYLWFDVRFHARRLQSSIGFESYSNMWSLLAKNTGQDEGWVRPKQVPAVCHWPRLMETRPLANVE
jgi:hypothetical protein